MKISRKLTIILTSVLIFVVIVVLACIVQAHTTDGTNNYTGVKLEAAQKALDFDQSEYSPALFSNRAKPHIESVEPTNENSSCTDDPTTIQYYTVTIRRIGLFGTTYGTRTYDLCRIAG